MPSGRDWVELLRSTFRGVGPADLTGLYSNAWKRARGRLIAEDGDSIESAPKRLKRLLKTANSVLFGLARRLAPARPVLFLAVLAFFLLSLAVPTFERHE